MCHKCAIEVLCAFENFADGPKTKNLQNIGFAGFTILFEDFALF